jgi:hypothetical protein
MPDSVNDSTIILNPGVGGDATDATVVYDEADQVPSPTPIKRERIVISGDHLREAVADLVLLNGGWKLPILDQEARNELTEIKLLLVDIRDLLKFGTTTER